MRTMPHHRVQNRGPIRHTRPYPLRHVWVLRRRQQLMLTLEHEWSKNVLKMVTEKTEEERDFEDVLDLLTDLQHYSEQMERREIELDDERFSDEYGFAERAWRE